jgi:hypothetical protein
VFSVERVRLNFALVFEQAVKNVDGFPDATWDEVAEQRDVAVGDVIVANAAISWAKAMLLSLVVRRPMTHLSGQRRTNGGSRLRTPV